MPLVWQGEGDGDDGEFIQEDEEGYPIVEDEDGVIVEDDEEALAGIIEDDEAPSAAAATAGKSKFRRAPVARDTGAWGGNVQL